MHAHSLHGVIIGMHALLHGVHGVITGKHALSHGVISAGHDSEIILTG